MSKGVKVEGNTITFNGSVKQVSEEFKQIVLGEDNTYIITSASINDDYCNYTYKVTKGIGEGSSHSVKGVGIIDKDLSTAFEVLNVHLACIDDTFKHAKIEIEDIDKLHLDYFTSLYTVIGIDIKGSEENESVIISGTKYISCAGGRIGIKTPKIPLDSNSSYKWYNELTIAVDEIRHQVKLYNEGKYTLPETEEKEKPNHKQLTIMDQVKQNQSDNYDETEDDDITNSRV